MTLLDKHGEQGSGEGRTGSSGGRSLAASGKGLNSLCRTCSAQEWSGLEGTPSPDGVPHRARGGVFHPRG